MNGADSASVRLSLKSTRSASRSPTAARTAATRSMPSSVAPATLILAVRKPRPSHAVASRAAWAGATAPIQALRPTSSRTTPPSSVCTGTPSARPWRSSTAISTAAFASDSAAASSSIRASSRCTLKASMPTTRSASRPTVAWTPSAEIFE